jgi:hypothetical protein
MDPESNGKRIQIGNPDPDPSRPKLSPKKKKKKNIMEEFFDAFLLEQECSL